MAYTFSFDNLVVSAFLTTPQINTLPVFLYGSLQYGPSPAVYAAAAVVFVFTLADARHRRADLSVGATVGGGDGGRVRGVMWLNWLACRYRGTVAVNENTNVAARSI